MANYSVSSDSPHEAKQKVMALGGRIANFATNTLPSYARQVHEVGSGKVGAANEGLLMQFEAVSSESGGMRTSLSAVTVMLQEAALPAIFAAIWAMDGVPDEQDPNAGNY